MAGKTLITALLPIGKLFTFRHQHLGATLCPSGYDVRGCDVRGCKANNVGNIGLICSHTGLNGAAKMVAVLAHGLADAGHRVRLYHRENAWLSQQDLPATVDLRAVDIGVRLLNRAEINRVQAELLDWGAMCIHSHGTSADRFSARLRLAGQLPSVATAHARILHPHWRKHDWIVTPSAYTQAWYAKTRLGHVNRMTVIPNAMDQRAIHPFPLSQAPSLRRGLGLPDVKFMILMIGTICKRKNQSAAIAMLKSLVDQDVDAALALVGPQEPKETAKLQAAAAKLDLTHRVTLLGERQEIPALIGASDCVLSTSRDEQASVSLLETLAGGRPAISSRTGSAPEAIENGQSGQVFDLSDTAPAISFMRRLATDSAFAQICASNARRRFEQGFTAAPFVAAHLEIYKKLATPF